MNEDKVIKNTPPNYELVFLTTTNIDSRHPPHDFFTPKTPSPPLDIPIHIVLTLNFKKNVTPKYFLALHVHYISQLPKLKRCNKLQPIHPVRHS